MQVSTGNIHCWDRESNPGSVVHSAREVPLRTTCFTTDLNCVSGLQDSINTKLKIAIICKVTPFRHAPSRKKASSNQKVNVDIAGNVKSNTIQARIEQPTLSDWYGNKPIVKNIQNVLGYVVSKWDFKTLKIIILSLTCFTPTSEGIF